MKLAGLIVSLAVAAAAIAWLALSAVAPARPAEDGFDLAGFGRLPVRHDGRVKPIDTVARVDLMALAKRQAVRVDGKPTPAVRWMLEVLARPERADRLEVFRVDHPDVKGLLGETNLEKKYFSYRQLAGRGHELTEAIARAAATEPKRRSAYERALAQLGDQLARYEGLIGLRGLYVPPRSAGGAWVELGPALAGGPTTRGQPTSADYLGRMIASYGHGDAAVFNAALAEFRGALSAAAPQDSAKAALEWRFNRFEPFMKANYLYVCVFLLACVSWLVWRPVFGGAAFVLLVVAVAAHTLGLASRMYIEGRPPVTNLYSSAVFVGWAAVVLAVVLEGIFRNGVGSAAAAAVAFPTLVVAHHLAAAGDTMHVMQAVLDTNFWLAAHVLTVTIGYAATFLAGALAAVCILAVVAARLAGGRLPRRLLDDIGRMVYGIVCFALLFSFVGTVLGGIWADQSWGRFWGWDTKENGALVIVIWNALILHAKWGRLVAARGLAVLAVFGNVVTAWAWFGVNELGVGLHSYGFIEGVRGWLMLFVAGNLVLMALGVATGALWRDDPDRKTSSIQ